MPSPSLGKLPARIADVVVSVFGPWSVYAIACVYLGVSFDELVRWSWLPALASVLLVFVVLRSEELVGEPVPTPTDRKPSSESPWPAATFALAVALAVAWGAGWSSYWQFWVAATAHLGTRWWIGSLAGASAGRCTTPDADWRDGLALATVAIAAVGITLALSRPDADDAYYLNALVASLDHPHLAVLSFDGMHGDPSVPIQQVIHRPQTYELFLAEFCRLTGASAATLYYILFPALFAVCFAVAHWVLIKSLAPSVAWLGLVIAFVLLLAWGNGHHAFGNFGFVRLFQGKAILILVFVPLIVYYAIGFQRSPGLRSWLLLGLSQLAAVTFTSSALVVAPACAALAMLGGGRRSVRGIQTLALGGLTCAAPLAILLLVRWEVDQVGPLISSGEGLLTPSDVALGVGWRTQLSLLAVLSLPGLAYDYDRRNADWPLLYVGTSFLLLLNGVTGPLVGNYAAKLFAWRLYWAVPFSALCATAFAIAMGRITGSIVSRSIDRSLAIPALLVAVFALFLVAGRWSIAPSNGVRIEWARPKVPPTPYALAERVVAMTSPSSTVLVPFEAAELITGMRGAPRLIAVRPHYTDNLSRYWGRRESDERHDLVAYVGGAEAPNGLVPWAMDQIDRRCIDIVATAFPVETRASLHEGLVARGFSRHDAAPYEIWSREGPSVDDCIPAPHPRAPQDPR